MQEKKQKNFSSRVFKFKYTNDPTQTPKRSLKISITGWLAALIFIGWLVALGFMFYTLVFWLTANH